MPRERITCVWCGNEIAATACEVRHTRNDNGTVIERRCPKCHKVLAAYLEEAGEFLGRMRNF